MPYALLNGTYEGYVSLNDVRSHSISRTLADEPVRYGGAILIDIAIARVAHDIDRNPRDFEVQAHDFQVQPDGVSWDVSVSWWIGCDFCEYTAVDVGLALEFTGDLCPVHYEEALAQEHADLHNDDIKSGIYDN